ncbi:MAG: hypothetical protein Tsb0021_10230 [Chlamydiales bacterium]
MANFLGQAAMTFGPMLVKGAYNYASNYVGDYVNINSKKYAEDILREGINSKVKQSYWSYVPGASTVIDVMVSKYFAQRVATSASAEFAFNATQGVAGGIAGTVASTVASKILEAGINYYFSGDKKQPTADVFQPQQPGLYQPYPNTQDPRYMAQMNPNFGGLYVPQQQPNIIVPNQAASPVNTQPDTSAINQFHTNLLTKAFSSDVNLEEAKALAGTLNLKFNDNELTGIISGVNANAKNIRENFAKMMSNTKV